MKNNNFSNNDKKELYTELVDAFPDMIFFLDTEFHIFDVNNAAKEALGDSIIGEKCYKVFGHAALCEECPSRKALETKETAVLEKYKPLMDKWYEVSSIPIKDNNSEIIAIVEQLKDISKRRIAEESLKRSESKFRSYVESSQDIIFTLNSEGIFEYVSPSWKDPLNYELDEVTGEYFLKFIHPEDREKSLQFLEDVLNQKGRDPIEYRAYNKVEGWKWHRINGSYILDSDGRPLLLGITRDITNSKENQEKIRRVSKEFEVVFEGAQDSMYLVDVIDDNIFRYLRANNSQTKVTGVPEDDLIGRTPQEAFGKIGKEIEFHYKKCVKTKDVYTYEAKRNFAGAEKIIETKLNPVIENGEVEYIVGATRDISKQRKAERELKDNLERNKRLIAIFEYQADSTKDILEYGLDHAIEITESKIGYIFFYDEKTKKFVLNAWSKKVMDKCNVKDIQVEYNLDETGLWGEAVRQGEPVILNNFNKHKDLQKGIPEGHVKLTTFATVPIFYDEEIVAVVGVANKKSGYTESDITQLTLLSNRLWESVEKHKAKKRVENERNKLEITLNAIGDGVISTDHNGKVEYINKVAQDITGFNSKEVVGKSFNSIFKIINESTKKMVESPVDIVLKTKKKIELEENSLLIDKKGKEIPVADTATPIIDEGDLIGVVIVFRDVTKERANLKRIEYLSFHDQLTGLYNRRYFEEKLKELSSKDSLPLSVIIADLNGLKLVNDGFGHQEGDKLLIKTAEILSNHLPKRGVVARVGGDEFAIVLPETSNMEVTLIKDKLEREVNEIVLGPVNLSVSFGISTKRVESQNIGDIVKVAEDNMYRQKLYKSPSIRGRTLNTIMTTLYEKSLFEEEHSLKVADYSLSIAKELKLSSKDISELQIAGKLHDIGKIVIDKSILDKKDALDETDWTVVKRHPEVGYRILSATDDMVGIATYILHHHEREDGSGYPRGLKGDEIPLHSKILAVADAYAAMTSERVYRNAFSREEAIEELKRVAGTQLDEEIVDVFINKVLKNDNQ